MPASQPYCRAIRVESQAGVGSTFHVELRLPAMAGSTDQPVESGASVEMPALNILVAEDNPVNQLVTSRVLEKRGHRVTVVSDGRAALEALKRGHFDLVLMDVQMPGMDGMQTTRSIRAQENGGRRIPIVALTAHAMSSDEQEFREAGMDAYVPKPVRTQELLEVIASCCTPHAKAM